MRPPFAIAFGLLAVSLPSCSKPQASPSSAPDAIDFYIDGELTEHRVPGLSLVIIKDGKAIKQKGYGVIDLETRAPATTDTPYHLASVTKIFTAAAVLTLIDEGELSLDDRLVALLPEVPEAWGDVTVRQLLSHTSGLPDIPTDPKTGTFPDESREQALKRAASLPIVARPGRQSQYIQTGYVLLGKIAEKKTGKPFARFMQERLFKPLSMDSTRYVEGRGTVAGGATSYSLVRYEPGGKHVRTEQPVRWDFPIPAYLFPCTGLTTTAADLVKWDLALSQNRILKPATLNSMWTVAPVDAATPPLIPGWETGWALGWVVSSRNGRRVAMSSGGGHTVYYRFLDDNITVIVQTDLFGSEPERVGWRVAMLAVPGLENVYR